MDGPGGEPRFRRSTEKSRRGNCPERGSAIGALDDGQPNISLVVGSLDAPDLIVPDVQHSYESSRPRWWEPALKTP